MFEQIAAHTRASFSAPACGKGAKTLWKRFVKDQANLTHVVSANGRATAGVVSGTTVRAPLSSTSRSAKPTAGLTIRQATVATEWRHSLQTDLVAITDNDSGATTLLQTPPGFTLQVPLPAGAYRIAAVRLADADELSSAPLVGVAALTVAPFERLPANWAEPGELEHYVHALPVGISGPSLLDLVFLGRTEIPELPPTFGSLLSNTPSTPVAA
jgi:hypothetical protein